MVNRQNRFVLQLNAVACRNGAQWYCCKHTMSSMWLNEDKQTNTFNALPGIESVPRLVTLTRSHIPTPGRHEGLFVKRVSILFKWYKCLDTWRGVFPPRSPFLPGDAAGDRITQNQSICNRRFANVLY